MDTPKLFLKKSGPTTWSSKSRATRRCFILTCTWYMKSPRPGIHRPARKRTKSARPDKTVATMDHAFPPLRLTCPLPTKWSSARLVSLKRTARNLAFPCMACTAQPRHCARDWAGIGPDSARHDHCLRDSHTSTHGAFGALAFGIGTSEIEHVLATQCLLQVKPKTCAVRVDGTLSKGVAAKDIILISFHALALAAAPATCLSIWAAPCAACQWKSA